MSKTKDLWENPKQWHPCLNHRQLTMDHQQVLFSNLDGIQALRQEAIKHCFKQKKGSKCSLTGLVQQFDNYPILYLKHTHF